MYRDLSIGTSKPTPSEQECIPHHLIDFLGSNESLTAKQFVDLAKSAVDQILLKNKIPLITCGTGFYLKAFLYGMNDFPEVPKEIKNKISLMGKLEKVETLTSLDPERFQEIHSNDEYRLDRSLEIALMGEKWHSRSPRGGYLQKSDIEWTGFYLDGSREDLYKRIDFRSEKMIESGLLEETKAVMDEHGEFCPALNSLGYNFAVENIQGKITLECLKEKFSQSHRNYAKRQITWFKKETFLKSCTSLEAFSFLKNIEP